MKLTWSSIFYILYRELYNFHVEYDWFLCLIFCLIRKKKNQLEQHPQNEMANGILFFFWVYFTNVLALWILMSIDDARIQLQTNKANHRVHINLHPECSENNGNGTNNQLRYNEHQQRLHNLNKMSESYRNFKCISHKLFEIVQMAVRLMTYKNYSPKK